MKYYIAYKQKRDFYLLGKLTPTSFDPGHAYKFLKECISEFPALMDEVKVVDESQHTFTLYEFLKKVKEYDNN